MILMELLLLLNTRCQTDILQSLISRIVHIIFLFRSRTFHSELVRQLQLCLFPQSMIAYLCACIYEYIFANVCIPKRMSRVRCTESYNIHQELMPIQTYLGILILLRIW